MSYTSRKKSLEERFEEHEESADILYRCTMNQWRELQKQMKLLLDHLNLEIVRIPDHYTIREKKS